ncbi:MAG TPA: hypothetical protein VKY26_08540 [Actinomycetota bacterium]|nr:hypothetical protein [Actinomycetota bacterium]
MSALPQRRTGVSVLLTCTDLDASVVARMFLRDEPWGLFVTCDGGLADQRTLQLLQSLGRLFGIDEVVVLHHTNCPAVARAALTAVPGDRSVDLGAEETGLRLADTLGVIRARIRPGDAGAVSGFVYDQDCDELIAWS